jgi:hypothetical protein
MSGKALLGAIILACAAVAGARDVPPGPDMDLLEYLGTFETAGGKAVDPVQLKEVPPAETKPQRPVRDKKAKEKKNTEKPPGKEAGDE